MKRIAVFVAMCLLVMQLPVLAGASGTCGENLVWEFDDTTGTLTISGQGEIDIGEYPGWGDFDDKIGKIVIEEGVTSICHGAFSGCKTLKTVVLPESLKVIGGNAFSFCRQLTDINLEHVTEIKDYAFSDCALTELIIPRGITKINSGAFNSCRYLKNIVWHDGITEIGAFAFDLCSDLTTVHLPGQVQTVGSNAFSNCYSLTDLKLNEGLQSIGNGAFLECGLLEVVELPDSLRFIDDFAFDSCGKLREVRFGREFAEFGGHVFRGCSKLTTFKLSKDNANFALDGVVLYNSDKTELLLMPEGFTGTYDIPEGTTSIAPRACWGSQVTAVTVPGSVKTVGKYAFSQCMQLQSLTLEEGVQAIGIAAFSDTAITELTIPKSVTFIGGSAFSGCKSLTKVVFKGDQPKLEKSCFHQVAGTLYYPGDLASWNTSQGYTGGAFEWVAYCSGVHLPVTDAVKAPTCTEDGISAESRCSLCDAVVEAEKVLPATGHRFGDWTQEVPPTTDDEGLAKRICADCGTVEEKTLQKLPKEPQQPTIPTEPSVDESDSPDTPEVPDTPDTPEVPDTPDTPAQSQPSVPAETKPENAVITIGAMKSEQPESTPVQWSLIMMAVVFLTCLAVGGFVLSRKNKK